MMFQSLLFSLAQSVCRTEAYEQEGAAAKRGLDVVGLSMGVSSTYPCVVRFVAPKLNGQFFSNGQKERSSHLVLISDSWA